MRTTVVMANMSSCMSRALNIIEVRSEITDYLTSWEIPSFVAATRVGWSLADSEKVKNRVRDMFSSPNEVKNLTTGGCTMWIPSLGRSW
jgi:predicted secreted protein